MWKEKFKEWINGVRVTNWTTLFTITTGRVFIREAFHAGWEAKQETDKEIAKRLYCQFGDEMNENETDMDFLDWLNNEYLR